MIVNLAEVQEEYENLKTENRWKVQDDASYVSGTGTVKSVMWSSTEFPEYLLEEDIISGEGDVTILANMGKTAVKSDYTLRPNRWRVEPEADAPNMSRPEEPTMENVQESEEPIVEARHVNDIVPVVLMPEEPMMEDEVPRVQVPEEPLLGEAEASRTPTTNGPERGQGGQGYGRGASNADKRHRQRRGRAYQPSKKGEEKKEPEPQQRQKRKGQD